MVTGRQYVVPRLEDDGELLQSILDELEKLDQHYGVAAIVPGLDAEAPSTLGFDVRLTTQDAILIRTDGVGRRLETAHNQAQRYLTTLIVPTAVGPFTLARGWASVEVVIDHQAPRFVTTHLEPNAPAIQLAQVKELILSAGASSSPVIFAGDFNTTADNSQDPTFGAYQTLVQAGFIDAWSRRRGTESGFTCCQAPDLRNSASLLNHRIDLVAFRGALEVQDIHLVGANQSDIARSGLWPSDHAGVVATFRIPDKANVRE